MAVALVVTPLVLALLAALVPWARWRPWLVPLGASVHLALVVVALGRAQVTAFNGWLVLDPLGRLVLPLLSLLFFVCSLYVPTYLRLRAGRPNRVFCAALLAFLGMMTLITESHHLGLMWVALEANTLASAPLLYFNSNPRSIEATWKYVLIGGVGIALALLGSFFLAYSALHSGREASLLVDDLVGLAPHLSRPWLHSAFVVLFVGYGTKMGLAPMHTWKPDAYGEAPGLVGALMAGGLTTCAFLALLRFYQICVAAGEGAFARELMVTLGVFSMAVAGVFMARQRDYKRMLAYSSVEHMGILVLGAAVGGAGLFGSLLHMLNNGFTKGVLFLSAANIHRHFGSKSTDQVQGALRVVPASAALFLLGFFAVTGAPPFGTFLSEFTILRAAVAGGQTGVAAAFLALLLLVFVGMGATVLAVVQGEAPAGDAAAPVRERIPQLAPIVLLLLLVLLLGVWIPEPLESALRSAARFVEGRP